MSAGDVINGLITYLTPAVVILGGARWLVGIIWKRYEGSQAEIRAEAKAHAQEVRAALALRADAISNELATYQETTLHTLSRIEQQTSKTNGRVTDLELGHAKIVGILEERKRHEE